MCINIDNELETAWVGWAVHHQPHTVTVTRITSGPVAVVVVGVGAIDCYIF